MTILNILLAIGVSVLCFASGYLGYKVGLRFGQRRKPVCCFDE